MTEEKALVPKLRFPEFQNAGKWTKVPLISLSNEPLSNGVFNDPKKVGSGYKLINVSDMYIDTVIDEERLSLLEISTSEFEANQVIDGDIFFTRSSLVQSGIAVSNIYLGNSCDVTFDGHLIRFRPNKSKVAPLFTHYLFKTAPIRSQLIARGKSATMTTIGQADVASVTLSYPEKNEQQKIAECLNSVDELIAAQARKVDALKTNKKGLMQQLFPREGETQPRLRFLEFQSADEWEGETLAELSKSISSGKDKAAPDGAFDLYGSTGIIGKTHSLSYSGIYLLVARVGANAGFLTKTAGEFGVTDNTLVITLKPGQNIDFIFYYLDQIDLNKMIFGSGQPLITGGQLKALSIQLPKEEKEQQRIASCLSSLDALIALETQKLAALKTHKKGLMQQLFPSPQEVQA